MAQRIVIDPITRIEGHLRIEAEVDAKNTITQRLFLRHHGARHRDHPEGPRPARGLGLRPARLRRMHHGAFLRLDPLGRGCAGHQDPKAANMMRNMMIAQQYVHDHVMHFYHLHALDWVDVVNALKGRSRQDVGHPAEHLALAECRRRPTSPTSRPRCRRIVDSGQLSIFCQCLLGPPGLQTAARSEPAGCGALPRSAGLAGARDPDSHHLRRQEPSPQLRRGRRAAADRPEQRHSPQRRTLSRSSASRSRGCRTSSTRCTCPTCWPSRPITWSTRRWARAWAIS